MAELARGGAASAAGQGLANIGVLLWERMQQREREAEEKRRYNEQLTRSDRAFDFQREQFDRGQANADRSYNWQTGPGFVADMARSGFRPITGGGTPAAAQAAGVTQIGDHSFVREPEPVNWQALQTTEGYTQLDPRSGATRPVMQDGRRAMPVPPEPPNAQRFFAEGGLFGWQPGSSVATPVTDPEGRPIQAPIAPRQNSAAIARLIAGNRTQMSVLDDAISGLQERPKSLGPLRFSEFINQWTDPEGTTVRANVADVGSLEIHDRSGAAVTASEFPRLKPFIPLATDRPEVALDKLRRMRRIIEEETRLLEGNSVDTGVDSGSPRLRTPGGGFDLSSISVPPPPGQQQVIDTDQYDYLRNVQGMSDAEIRSRYVVR